MTPVTKPHDTKSTIYEDDVIAVDDGAPDAVARRGRPREEDRTPLILSTVVELVDEAGYDHLRMQDVAERAGVGLATIYRRWPTKKDLFLDALRAKDFDFPTSDDPRADLIAAYSRLAEGVSGGSRLAVGCLAAEPTDPELLEAFRAVGVRKLTQHLRGVIARAVGDDDPDLDLRADLGPGIIVQRSLLMGESTTDPKLIERLADLALAPFPAATPPKKAKKR